MPHTIKLFRLASFIGLLSMVLLASCSSSSKKSKVGGLLNLNTDLDLTFVIDKSINPDEHQRPSPVFIRLYELKSPTVFSKADFIDLFERDAELLKADFVAKQTLKPFTPGETRTEHFELQESTQQIALYAEFSQYRGSTYKVIIPVTLHNVRANTYEVKLTGTTMTLEKK